MTPRPATGRVVSVNVVAELRPEPTNDSGVTAIDKRAVDGPVRVGRLALDGDHVEDVRNHGGADKAVYAYAVEDLARWADELGRDLPAGLFGENLTVEGLDLTGALVGERWRLGGDRDDAVVLEVRMPRIPCQTFARRMDEPHWVKRFGDRGDLGVYLSVVHEGTVRAGDPIEVVSRPSHDVAACDLFPITGVSSERLRAMLDEVDVAANVREVTAKAFAARSGAATTTG